MNAEPRGPLLRLLAGEAVSRVPVVPLLGAFSAQYADIPVGEAFRCAELQARAQVAAVEAFGPDAVFPFMDLTAEAEALGAGLRWAGDAGPVVERPVAGEGLLGALSDRPIQGGRLLIFASIVRRLARDVPEACAIGAYVLGPWTLICSAMGLAPAARLVRRDRRLVARLAAAAAGFAELLIGRFINAGADVIMILEPCAADGILAPADFAELVRPHISALTAACRQNGAWPVVHVCGDAQGVLPELAAIEGASFSLDAPVDLVKAAEILGPDACVWGNIAPVGLLMQGTADEVSEACTCLIDRMAQCTRFVLATGCEVPSGARPENVRAMVRSSQRMHPRSNRP